MSGEYSEVNKLYKYISFVASLNMNFISSSEVK